MSGSDLMATLEIKSGLQREEPWAWASVVTVTVDESGFRDSDGVGRSGNEPGTLDTAQVAQKLLNTFSREDLCLVLDHLVRLREALQP